MMKLFLALPIQLDYQEAFSVFYFVLLEVRQHKTEGKVELFNEGELLI